MKSLCIPSDILKQHLVVLGKTGAGKSSALRHVVEWLLDHRKRVCIVDPKGDWAGLKVSADGRSPQGGYPVIAFGDFKMDDARDVPINERSGRHVAELITSGNRPCIIGFRGWMQGAMTRFWIDFASTLFNANSGELYLVGDEFHNFSPKGKIMDPEAGKCLHWSNRVLSEGRGIGLVCLIASQRPQKVHNDTLTSCETLVAMRVVHKADRDAVKAWIDGCGDEKSGKEVLDSLASLPRGEAWVWSPEIGFGPQRVKFPMFHTFDSFAPPQLQKKVHARGWADVNLDEVTAKLSAVIEEEKRNDPAELRRTIAELRKETLRLARGSGVAQGDRQAAADRIKRVEVPVIKDKQIRSVEKIVDRLEALGKQYIEAGQRLVNTGKEFAAALRAAPVGTTTAIHAGRQLSDPSHGRVLAGVEAGRTVGPRPAPIIPKNIPTPRAMPDRASIDAGQITPRQQRFLDAAATLTTLNAEVTRETVAAWNGIHPRTGSYGEDLKALADAGLIVKDRGMISVTEAGAAAAETIDASEAIERAKSGLTKRQGKFFDMIVAAYPETITRETIAEAFGIHHRTGSFGQDLGALVSRGLVEGSRGVYRARDFLFPF